MLNWFKWRKPPELFTVQLKKLPLSAKLADRIRIETGVSLSWLLGGRPDLPPVDVYGNPYRKDLFDRVRANEANPDSGLDDAAARFFLVLHTWEIASLLLAAFAKDKVNLCSYKIHQALRELRAEYGVYGPTESFQKPSKDLQARTGKKPDLNFISEEFHQALLKLCREKGLNPQACNGPLRILDLAQAAKKYKRKA